jgi:hypothetical protein
MITVPSSVTATQPPGRYIDALRVVTAELSETVWIGTILVDADPS